MTQDEARRLLRTVRFSPTKGRSLTMASLAARCAYSREHLHRVAISDCISERLAECLGRAFQSVINGQNQATLSYDMPRGGARKAVRHDDARLRTMRALRGTLEVDKTLREGTENAVTLQPPDGDRTWPIGSAST